MSELSEPEEPDSPCGWPLMAPATPAIETRRLILRPPRALNGRQVGALFAVLSGTMWVVALLGAAFGNVFAPPFALLHSVIAFFFNMFIIAVTVNILAGQAITVTETPGGGSEHCGHDGGGHG